jgi:monoamine oxidase
MSPHMSRRDLIKTGALATAGMGGMLVGAESAAARAQTAQTDYVVVGAGYAGLGAAWELFKRGKRVMVLDANDRVGGRVWSSRLSDGTLFEIGGQWVSDSQTDIRDLMRQLDVEHKVYQTLDEGRIVFVDADGSRGT